MSVNEIEAKCRELRQLQNLIEEAQQEADVIKDQIKAHMGDSDLSNTPTSPICGVWSVSCPPMRSRTGYLMR